VCLGSALGLALLPASAAASTPEKTGWWNLSPVSTTPPTTVPPTTVPPTTLPSTTLPSTTLPIKLPGLPAGLPASRPSAGSPAATSTTLPQTSPKGELQVTFDGKDTTAFAA